MFLQGRSAPCSIDPDIGVHEGIGSERPDFAHALHVASGDAMAAILRQAFPDARVLPWREALCDGPAPADVRGEAWVSLRAEWLATEYGLDRKEILAGLRRLEDTLDEAVASGNPVVLWFGRDLHCQANMLHAAWRLRALGGQGRLSLILVEEATFDADEARSRLPAARPLTPERSAWLAEARMAYGAAFLGASGLNASGIDASALDAFGLAASGPAASDLDAPGLHAPDGLPAFLAKAAARDADHVALPEAVAALRLHLTRFPAKATGLGRPEETLLRLLADGAALPASRRADYAGEALDAVTPPEESIAFCDLFRRFGQAELGLGFGDWQVWGLLRRLASGPAPLVAASLAMLPPGSRPPETLSATRFRITPIGRAVLSGEADRVALNGLDAWLGGVRLSGRDVPRRLG